MGEEEDKKIIDIGRLSVKTKKMFMNYFMNTFPEIHNSFTQFKQLYKEIKKDVKIND